MSVNLTKRPAPRAFRISDVQALGRSRIPLTVCADIIHNKLPALGAAFARKA